MGHGYKLTMLLKRRSDLESEEFTIGWLNAEKQNPIVASGLSKYRVHTALEGGSPISGASESPYDAIIETWWERKNDAAEWVISESFDNEWLSARKDLIAETPAAVGGAPMSIVDRAAELGEDYVSVLVFPVARRSLRFSDFVEHWAGTHADLALVSPGSENRVARIENTPAPNRPPSKFTATHYDGVGSLLFNSREALQEEFESQYYRDVLAPDEGIFTNKSVSVAFVGKPIDLA